MMIYLTLANGRDLPVGTGAVPICGFDADGNPQALRLSAAGGIAGLATEERQSQTLGQMGWDRFDSGTTEQTGEWIAIKALTDSVFAVDGLNIAGTKTGIPLAVGDVLPGAFTKITRTSGDFIAYKA